MTQATGKAFSIQGTDLVLDSGHKASFKYPVAEAIDFQDAIVVRLEISVGQQLNENVYGVDYNGQILWQIQRQRHVYSNSPYTYIGRKGDAALLSNWDGLELTIEPATGNVMDESYGR